jgi:hypothetical protein
MPSFSPLHLPVNAHELITEWSEQFPCSERRSMAVELAHRNTDYSYSVGTPQFSHPHPSVHFTLSFEPAS